MPALRGFSLSSHSYESDENVVPIASLPQTYHCPLGHTTTLRFAAAADEIPDLWDCPRCGRPAHRDETAARRAGATVEGQALVSPRTNVAGKTHWEMLTERRSVEELEALLEERLQQLRNTGR